MTGTFLDKSPLKFKVESFDDCADEIIEMSRSWWYESKFYKDWNIEFDLDYDMFNSTKDHILILVGRDKEGKIGAYYVGCLQNYGFNKNMTYAHEIVWHVRKDLQGGKVVHSLLVAIQTVMESLGIKFWTLCLPNEPRYNRTQDLLENMGYKFQDKTFIRKGNING